ncbi:superoxide dismutase [Candidatus Paracaedibacter symbiosus]|uniref:superoxide dismutase n=1 Tax=Candidatus Paracaedibacter symbiosus TaxID=244582 RepID=UPI0005096194|nr:superoxide dismutase [Candidatus Paracaedibacter symbiosus]
MTHQLPPLPYEMNALEPHITANTLSFHYGKHHQAYVTNLNNLLKDHPLTAAPLEEVIMKSAGKSDMMGIFNNAAQVWNHTFYWHCMKSNGGGMPSDSFKAKLEATFGSFEKFCEEFKQAAVTQFGSGWAWLVADKEGSLKILKTGNADLPMAHGVTALLTCDVWEHAYYLDFQNRRPDYVDTFLKHLINWDFVESQLPQ